MRRARRVLALLVSVAMVPVAGCGRAEPATTGSTLTITTERDLGYEQLTKAYEKAHPGVTVVQRVAGDRAGDVTVVDDYALAALSPRASDFADLAGGQPRPWALPIGVEGLGMCYRRSLLEDAGMPTDRRQLAERWSTWTGYLEAGQQFQAAKLPAHWVDSALSVYDAVLSQQPQAYFSARGDLQVAGSPAVKSAWRFATSAVAVGESAQLRHLTLQWTAAAQSRRFATLPCSSWLLGWMRRNIPNVRGDWDMTAAPTGRGSANHIHLVVPRSGAHAREAAQLAAWLAAPEQQAESFAKTGILPALATVRNQRSVRGATDPFLNDAPVGEILAASVDGRSPQPVGPGGEQVRSRMDQLVSQVDGWELSAEAGWSQVVSSFPG